MIGYLNLIIIKVVFFSKSKRNVTRELSFQDCELDIVSCHEHLGLTLSDDLKWYVYINDIVNIACKKIRTT